MALLADKAGQKYRVLYQTLEGREYWMELTSVGSFSADVPFIVYEENDDTVSIAGGFRYSSLEQMATQCGCMWNGELTSVDPTN